ncbi:unnamed protein product [Ceratitis capitata]|uniref:(Mediterranean fruit fly) hypothetical protein n=1 Tax=Ceratitis capitata TaxID=7213 RepID=A0A811U842_CERCA|nr:unnamed protein product [Ceratitis capitata]
MKRLQPENGCGHIVTVECSPRTENNLMKDPEFRAQLSQFLTAEFSGPFHQKQQKEDFVLISITNRNNSNSHKHRIEKLVEVSPQMENEHIDQLHLNADNIFSIYKVITHSIIWVPSIATTY